MSGSAAAATAQPGPGAAAGPATAADLVTEAGRLLTTPGLVVITGGPGAGRSTALRQLASAYRGTVFTGGGLAMLRTSPALALARAVRVRLPAHDPALLAEAVRSRVRNGLLLVDDLHWADPATLAALPLLASYCRVAAALRTPHRLPASAERALRDAATGWLAVPPLTPGAARNLIRRTAPGLDEANTSAVLARAGGVPLAVLALARHAHFVQVSAAHPVPNSGSPAASSPDPERADPPREPADQPNASEPNGCEGPDQIAYALAQALADLTRPARTALAALGLLGRPATATVLGTGVAELAAAGLVTVSATSSTPPAGTAQPSEVAETAEAAEAAEVSRPSEVAAVSPYVAEVAAGLLDPAARRALHRRLADLVPPAEAARHLAAAGDSEAAYRHAVTAAARTHTSGDRADLLLLACQLPDLPATLPPLPVRLDAARAALACGRARAVVQLLAAQDCPVAAVLRGEALLQLGEPQAAREAVAAVTDDAFPADIAGRDRILLLTAARGDLTARGDLHQQITARHGECPAHPGLRAALAALRAMDRAPGWEHALASAATAAGAAGDPLTARWSAWLLVETLAGDGRLTEAARTAGAAASACAADLAYSWQTRFLAAELWCRALRGTTNSAVGGVNSASGNMDTAGDTAGDTAEGSTADNATDGPGDSAGDILRRAGDLTDRTLPAPARGYAAAAASLVEADGGLLASARGRLATVPAQPGATTTLLDWVIREAAWLDGQPNLATGGPATASASDQASPLIDGLSRITARWAAHDIASHHGPDPDPDLGDTARAGDSDPGPDDVAPTPVRQTLVPVRQTLAAWAGDPGLFTAAAQAWHHLAIREEVRCLLAQGLRYAEPARALPPLLAAEQLADAAGLTVLAGRARQGLRRHAVHRPNRKGSADNCTGLTAGTGTGLTARERDVLRLVARGEPTRRIARQLGVSGETVETHVRAGMRKLGARTRTEAAALAIDMVGGTAGEQEEAV